MKPISERTNEEIYQRIGFLVSMIHCMTLDTEDQMLVEEKELSELKDEMYGRWQMGWARMRDNLPAE